MGTSAPFASQAPSRESLARQIDHLIRALQALDPPESDTPAFGIGHNNPPESPIDRIDQRHAIAAAETLKHEVIADRPDAARVEAVSSTITQFCRKILLWVGRKADKMADEFATEAGRSLGNSNRLMLIYLGIASQAENVLQTVQVFFKPLIGMVIGH